MTSYPGSFPAYELLSGMSSEPTAFCIISGAGGSTDQGQFKDTAAPNTEMKKKKKKKLPSRCVYYLQENYLNG